MVTAADLKSKVEEYLRALGRFDLEAAADCFTDDAFYSHPPYSGEGLRHEVRGRAAIIELFERRGHKPEVGHEVRSAAIEGSDGSVAGVFTSDGEVLGSFLSAVTLAEDGRIASYAAYASVPAVGYAISFEQGAAAATG